MCDSVQMDLWLDFVCFDSKYVIFCLNFFNEGSGWTLFCSLSNLYLKVLASPIYLSHSVSKNSWVESAGVANA